MKCSFALKTKIKHFSLLNFSLSTTDIVELVVRISARLAAEVLGETSRPVGLLEWSVQVAAVAPRVLELLVCRFSCHLPAEVFPRVGKP